MRETKGAPARDDRRGPGDGAITLPTVLLIDTGTSGAAEFFASALSGNQRADLIGEHTIGRAGVQKLIKLPDGAGLWLSTIRYLTPAGTPLHEKGLEPTVAVDEPDVEFGQPGPRHRPDARQGDRASAASPPGSPKRKPPDILTCFRCRRVAQRLERLLDTQEVGGSSPPVPTIRLGRSAASLMASRWRASRMP